MTLRDMKFPYDREAMRKKTREEPEWLHFGAGNIFRAFPCTLAERMLGDGLTDRGIIAAEGFDPEIIEKIYRPHDDLSLLVTLCGDGTVKKTPIGCVAESLYAADSIPRLKEIFRSPSLHLVSFTITEKGYAIPDEIPDLERSPSDAYSFMGQLTYLLYERFGAGAPPIALLSMDNCSGNGDRLRAAVLAYARGWIARGALPQPFADWLTDEGCVSFPCSMIDKITPRPDERIAGMLRADGFCDTDTVVTEKHTYIAPFVNAEAPEYLVVEDKFPAGRPPLDRVGVIFTDRETVFKTERMKVSTCLNPLHTALAVFGCLLGYTLISSEVADPDLSALIRRLGYVEGLPVVTDPGIISPRAFIDEVVNVRLPNPFMPDTPQRIATDTSQKLSVRFGQTVREYISRGLPTETLVAVPLVYAGWCRYLLAVDDGGAPFTPSSDPRYDEMRAHLADIGLGDSGDFTGALAPILSDASVFGLDVTKTPLFPRVADYFGKMVFSPGAVRKTLHEVLGEHAE